MSSISETWGTNAHERNQRFPCDGIIAGADAVLYRGVTIKASAEIIFRWLCQMRAAPYSYDWIDNFGQTSPQELTPGLDDLVTGQDVMRIFDLIAFETSRHLTLRLKGKTSAARTFGDIAVSYVIVPNAQSESGKSCRLLVKLVGKYPNGLRGLMMKTFLPWGDLIMMRRQLLNFKRLAEKTQEGLPGPDTLVNKD